MSQVQERRRSGREKIEIKDLRNFVVVAEELNISRAAHRLGMQQSPLSRTLQALQKELGTKLIDTTGKRVKLTRQGLRVWENAQRILLQLSQLYGNAHASDEHEPIRIGFSYSATGHLPRLLERCRDDNPERVVSLIPSSLHNPNGVSDVDVVIAPERAKVPGVSAVELWREELWAVVPSGHELCGYARPLVAELGRLGPIYCPFDLAHALGGIARSNRFVEVPYLDASLVESLMTHGNCTALLPSSLCRPLELAGLHLKPVADLQNVAICAFTVDANERGLGQWLADLACA